MNSPDCSSTNEEPASPGAGDAALGWPIAADEVHLWYLRSSDVTNEQTLEGCRQAMNADEGIRQARFMFPEHRHQYLVTRGFVRGLLGRYLAKTPGSMEFAIGNFGKPHLADNAARCVCEFNVSHTDGMIVIAVTRGQSVGVDVERFDRKVELGLAERYFAAIEAARLVRQPAHDQTRTFFDYWTLKEALIKAHGKGLSLPLDQFWFPGDDLERAIRVEFAESLSDEMPDLWQFFTCRPGGAHRVAIAVRRTPGQTLRMTVREMPVDLSTLALAHPAE